MFCALLWLDAGVTENPAAMFADPMSDASKVVPVGRGTEPLTYEANKMHNVQLTCTV